MGSRLIAQAITYALPRADLSPAARTLLLVMCHTAQDNASNPLYYAGSTHLARALGYPIAIDGPTGSERTTAAGQRAVKRAVAELRAAGLIDRLESLPRTWKRRWLITLPGLRATSPEGTRVSPHEGTRESPLRGHGSPHTGDTGVPTQGTRVSPPEEETEEETEEKQRRTM